MPEHSATRRRVSILGIRGVPASHGGFETFAARLAVHLVSVGWDVSVYCQEDAPDPASGASLWRTTWRGAERIHIAVGPDTPLNSIRFDWKCVSHAATDRPDVALMLGYNTAVFALRLRVSGVPTVINMDGMEWLRPKWGRAARAWLFVNDWAGCLLAHHLVADHPQIERHLRSRVRRSKITVIPYGADLLEDSTEDRQVLADLGLAGTPFATLIARPEPENSVLEIVQAFSAKPRGMKLIILGNVRPDIVPYHARLRGAASDEVLFMGAIYQPAILRALRFNSRFYIHGHRVGGCNPSLLEAMGAGNAVLAHDNRFNRWVVRDGALYFADPASCARALEQFLNNDAERVLLGQRNLRRARNVFHWSGVLQSYASLIADLTRSETDPLRAPASNARSHWQLDAE